jgi:hypothetical protein
MSSVQGETGAQSMSNADGTNTIVTSTQSVNLDTYAVGNTVDAQAANKTISTPEVSKQKVKKLVQAERRRELERAIRAKASFVGSPRIRARATFGIAGVDRSLCSLWYGAEMIHKITSKGYVVDGNELRKGAYAQKSKTKPSSTPTSSGPNSMVCDNKFATCANQPRALDVNLESSTMVNDSEGSVAPALIDGPSSLEAAQS